MKNSKLICLFILSSTLIACAAGSKISGSLPKTFLEDVNLEHKIERLPFDHSWVVEGVDWSKYTKIYLKPVRFDLLPEDAWKASVSVAIVSKEDYLEKAKEVAAYFSEQIDSEIRATKGPRSTVVEAPEEGALTLEVVLTELEFSKPLATAGSLAVPIPGSGVALASMTDPHITFAARLTDSITKRLLATVGNRKFSPTRIVNFNKLTISSANREICQIEAKALAESLNSDSFSRVTEKRFDLLPW